MCCGGDDDDCDDNPGPDVRRRCTDACCLPVLLVFMLWPACAVLLLKDVDGAYALTHGHDHYGQFCGKATLKDKAYVAYPDLENDFKQDPSLMSRYGVCVEKCPLQFEHVMDYPGQGGVPMRWPNDPKWMSALPTSELAGRCIPYDPPPRISEGARFCADPGCIDIGDQKRPTAPREVCGLKKDGTKRFWLLSKADDILIDGWRREGAGQEVIEAREAMPRSGEKCKVEVIRDTRVKTDNADSSPIYSLLTKYTGYIFTMSARVYMHKTTVLSLGVGGSMLLSFVIIMGFACCVQCILNVLVACLFLVLTIMDYVLFVQAGMVTGKKGRMILDAFGKAVHLEVPQEFGSLLQQQAHTEEWQRIYAWCAIGLAVGIFALACAALATRKNFRILVALLREAATTMREMPSLLLAPFILTCSMVAVSLLFLWVALSISTARAADVPKLAEAEKT